MPGHNVRVPFEIVYGVQLAQVRPTDTNASTVLTANDREKIFITSLNVANSGGGSRSFRLFHDDDGTTYDITTALYYDLQFSSNGTYTRDIPAGIAISPGGSIGFRASHANELTLTLYGFKVSQEGSE